ncbi:MAG: DAK2 domain-containing protein [Actinobacteria bacterium]|nr:DAK2 domain-containing protein [Actinomycetota bacterium]
MIEANVADPSPKSIASVLVRAAAAALSDRVEEVNRLNVFPVPDGDTGTNMSLTMEAVISALTALPDDADIPAVCKAITHGSLMGARGNSGVILSQIIRGLCESFAAETLIDSGVVASALQRSVEVSFQAVRKPVEGTILTVLRDTAKKAKEVHGLGASLDELLEASVQESFESVKRTPELLPVLKENNVVDAGGYGLAILGEGLLAAYEGKEVIVPDVSIAGASGLLIEVVDDWDDSEYLYCTEFLLYGEDIDKDAVSDFVQEHGGSELVIGDQGQYKIHVHTDSPGAILSYMTTIGEISDVHVNNMRRQSAQRSEGIAAAAKSEPHKPIGIVTVASGDGISAIFKSLGVDQVVSGGQTMNPSTAELLKAASRISADSVIILPNNKNVIMSARQAAEHAEFPISVVPTRSIPQALTAILEMDPGLSLEENVANMAEAIEGVRTGEITTAIKDSKANGHVIKKGDIIGIADDQIAVVGADVFDVAEQLVAVMIGDLQTLTLFAGEEFSDEQMEELRIRIQETYPKVEVETYRGEQPLYPIIISAE